MKNRKQVLPKQLEPQRLAELDTTLEGELSLQQMPRLLELIAERKGAVKVALRFAKNAEGKRIITGQIETDLVVICQRCLQQMHLPMQIDVRLCLISDDRAANQMPEGYEPLIVAETPMELSEIVEDELLLSVPQFPKHDAESCNVKLN